MAIPTPDQTPDIRLKNETVADLEAATSPNGERTITVEPTADADIGEKRLGYVDADGNGHIVLNKDENARVADLEVTGTLTASIAGDAETIWSEEIEDRALDVNALGSQVLTNPAMIGGSISGWVDGAAVGTKTAESNGEGGTCLRLAYLATGSPWIQQFSKQIVGQDYILIYRYRTDGTHIGRIGNIPGAFNLAATSDFVTGIYGYTAASVDSPYFYYFDSVAGYLELDYAYIFPIRDVKSTGKNIRFDWVENLFTQSETFGSDWTKTACTVDDAGVLSTKVDLATDLPVEFKTIDGTVTDTLHAVERSYSMTSGVTYTVECELYPLAKTWAYISIGAAYAYINLATGTSGTTSGLAGLSLINDNGRIIAKMQYKASSTAAVDIKIGAANADTDNDFAGVAGTDDIGIIGARIIAGTIADACRIPYWATTTAAETGKHIYLHDTETLAEYRQRLGLLELVVNDARSGIWETPKKSDASNLYEYFAPGYSGTAYYVDFGPLATAGSTLLISGVTDMLDCAIRGTDAGGNTVTGASQIFYSSFATNTTVWFNAAASEIRYAANAALSFDGGWVIYRK